MQQLYIITLHLFSLLPGGAAATDFTEYAGQRRSDLSVARTMSGVLGHQARYPASYTSAIRRRTGHATPLSCCLSAAGLRFSVTLSRQGLPPPLRSAYRPACAYPRLPGGP
jgi:hypothetical protein